MWPFASRRIVVVGDGAGGGGSSRSAGRPSRTRRPAGRSPRPRMEPFGRSRTRDLTRAPGQRWTGRPFMSRSGPRNPLVVEGERIAVPERAPDDRAVTQDTCPAPAIPPAALPTAGPAADATTPAGRFWQPKRRSTPRTTVQGGKAAGTGRSIHQSHARASWCARREDCQESCGSRRADGTDGPAMACPGSPSASSSSSSSPLTLDADGRCRPRRQRAANAANASSAAAKPDPRSPALSGADRLAALMERVRLQQQEDEDGRGPLRPEAGEARSSSPPRSRPALFDLRRPQPGALGVRLRPIPSRSSSTAPR